MKSIFLAILIASTSIAYAQTSSSNNASLTSEVNAVYPQAQALYVDLHEHPELSLHEVNTAAKLAGRMRVGVEKKAKFLFFHHLLADVFVRHLRLISRS